MDGKYSSKLLPYLTYHIQQGYTQNRGLCQTNKIAHAYFTIFRTCKAIDVLDNALESEETVSQKATEGFVKEIINEELERRISKSEQNNIS